MKTKHLLISVFALTLMVLAIPNSVKAQQYSLYVGQSTNLYPPSVSGTIGSAAWTCDKSNDVYVNGNKNGATAMVNQYFSGTATITCTYVYTYYVGGQLQHSGSMHAYYYITCRSSTVTLNKSEVTLKPGQEVDLTYTNSSGYDIPLVLWKTSDRNVASIDGNEKVSGEKTVTIIANKVGECVITCYGRTGNTDPTCKVIVKADPPIKIELPATATTKVGESVTLTPTLTPPDAYTTIKWKSSDETVATVSGGKVSGKKPGTTKITATTDNGLTAECIVTVGKGSVTVSADVESGVYASGKTVTLKANRNDADIYYTLDGSMPTTSSTRYTGPITLTKSVTLKAIATGSNYETSSLLTRQYQITTLAVNSSWDETIELPPFFIPVITFSKAVNKSIDIDGVKLSKGSATIAGQPLVQDGKLYFVPVKPLDAGSYTLTIPENAVMDANGEPNLVVQQKLLIGEGFGSMPKQVIGGKFHALIIKEDGSLWACGRNGSGQLGDGTTTTKALVKIMDDVASASAGGYHSLIVKTDGSLWACGLNEYGQLGDGTTTDRTTPVKIMDGVASVSAGINHSLIVKTDGSLWACGKNSSGQLGDGTTTDRTTPQKIMDGVVSVSAGQHSLIVKTDNSLWACGPNNHGQYGDGTTTSSRTFKKIMDNVTSASAGWLHSLIVKIDGSLWACGWNTDGQLGDGTSEEHTTPIKIMDGVDSASAHWRHSLFLKNDGSLWGCGWDSHGQLGYGTTQYERVSPVKIMDDVSCASAVDNESSFIKKDGSLWACGSNAQGALLMALYNGTSKDYSTPVCIIPVSSFSHVTSISLQQTSRQMALGSQFVLIPNMMPNNSTCETMVFKSSNSNVATVSSRGIVEAKAKGTATITVTVDGKYTARCEVEVKNRTMDVVMSPTGYATFYDSQSAFSLPSGLSAQVVPDISNSKISYQNLSGNVIPKNVAVMLISDTKRAGTYTLTATESNATYNGTNLLHGSDEATTTTGNGYHYKLSYGQTGTTWSDVFGWYWGAQNGTPFQIDGHKAWLVVPGGSTRATGFTIDGDATEIIDIDSDNEAIDIYYDMQGRRIATPTRSGLYIKNGKKVIIK